MGHEVEEAEGGGYESAEEEAKIGSPVMADVFLVLAHVADVLLHLYKDVLCVLGNLFQNGDAGFHFGNIGGRLGVRQEYWWGCHGCR